MFRMQNLFRMLNLTVLEKKVKKHHEIELLINWFKWHVNRPGVILYQKEVAFIVRLYLH